MKDKRFLFETEKVSKAVWTFAIPAMISMLVMLIYNLADTFFIGQIGDPLQVTAISIVMPMFTMLMGIGSLFGAGASSAISRSLGAGETNRTKQISSFSFYGGLTVGTLFALIVLLLIVPISNLLGASKDTMVFVNSYLKYIAIGSPFIIISYAFGNIVRSEGSAKVAMFGMMVGTIINIILDPIMILTLGMGVAGAAIATVIGNVCATLYYIVYLNKNSKILSVKLKDFTLKHNIPKEIITIGFPSSVRNFLMSISVMFINGYLGIYGDNMIAAYGIASKGSMLLPMLLMGFAGGAQPLIGYAYGAKNKGRLNEIVKYCIKISLGAGAIVSLIIFSLSPFIVKLFIKVPDIIEMGTKMLRYQTSTHFMIGIIFVSMVTIQAIGKPASSLILTLSRQGLVFIPTIIIGNMFFGLDGLIYAQPFADIASVIIAIGLLKYHLKQIDKNFMEPIDKELN